MCEHYDQLNMAYMDWHQDATKRRKRGEKQIFCHECGKYVWAEFWTNNRTSNYEPSKNKS